MRTAADTADREITSQVSFAPGTKAGPWIVEHELGRGGMGAVYAVTHDTIGKRAALKVLHEAWSDRRDADRILLEARVVNQVEHPGIVDIFETGTLPDGRPYIVMERLDGLPLHQRAHDGKLLPTFVIDVLLQICDALAAAHAAGIVHRDLKPDNVFLCETADADHPRVKLLDWGIAKMVVTDVHRTLDGQVVGTPQYLSPEQARGAPVTTKSDIYSLGVMTYELFLEQPPFEAGSAVELLAMHLHAAPFPPRDLWPNMPARLEQLVLAMLAKDPAQRPPLVDVIATLTDVRDEVGCRRPCLVPPESRMVAQLVIRSSRRAHLGVAETEHIRTRSRPRWPAALVAAGFLVFGLLFSIKHTRRSDAETRTPHTPVATQSVAVQPPAPAPVIIGAPELDPAPHAPIAPQPRALAVKRPQARASTPPPSGKPRPTPHVDPDGTLEAY